jgi:hypothetical protein
MIVTGLTHFILPILRKVPHIRLSFCLQHPSQSDSPSPLRCVRACVRMCVCVVCVHYKQSNELPFLYLLSILCIPCSLLYIVMYVSSPPLQLVIETRPLTHIVLGTRFFFVFELILNGFAEITRFADRHFYDDWWYDTQHTTHNTQHTTHNTQHATRNTQHATHNTQHFLTNHAGIRLPTTSLRGNGTGPSTNGTTKRAVSCVVLPRAFIV